MGQPEPKWVTGIIRVIMHIRQLFLDRNCFTLWKKPGALYRLGARSTTNPTIIVSWIIYHQLLSQPNIGNPPCQTRRKALESKSDWYRETGVQLRLNK